MLSQKLSSDKTVSTLIAPAASADPGMLLKIVYLRKRLSSGQKSAKLLHREHLSK